MKKINIWFLGYIICAILVALIFSAEFSDEFDAVLGLIFCVIFSVSHTSILHSKMLKDDNEYKINVMDERNIAIKEKAGNITNMITLTMLGCALILFLILNYNIPAIVVGTIIFLQPVILILTSRSIEKKM